VAVNRIFSDGTGWVAQLAVSKDERHGGLGRALLAESLRRLRAAGADRLGMEVQAANRVALAMYLDAGLPVDREWRYYAPPVR
jgi:ribosomal-protein-alanine N-acetyltransferase